MSRKTVGPPKPMRRLWGPLFRPVRLSLVDLLGHDYVDAVVTARSAVSGEGKAELRRVAREKVDFYPRAMADALSKLLPRVGQVVAPGLGKTRCGAGSAAFSAVTKTEVAPLTGWGYYRVGEGGRLFLLSKSEHYHALLGHSFPGYRLVEHARRLGIPNATHNNTRGFITRLLEEEIVRTVAGIAPGQSTKLARTLTSTRAGVPNRVLNLQTGSLAVEAGIKLMLGHFYKAQDNSPEPAHKGKTPVFVVVGDDLGGLQANYHGTTLIAQALRGMWPGLRAGLERAGLMKVVAVRPNSIADLEDAFAKYHRGRYRLAGVMHELVMMNYGAVLLSRAFIKRMYDLAERHGVPTLVDEIQSCLWSPRLYMFREYGISPRLVVLGKGFSGGECAASRIVFDATMDCLPQFGALVTNGQEELSSLAYLVTMRWAEANTEVTAAVGDYYERRLRELVEAHPRHLTRTQGRRHLSSLGFRDMTAAKAFVKTLVDGGLDISVQTYKAECPPMALTKLPLTAGYEVVDEIVPRMDRALRQL